MQGLICIINKLSKHFITTDISDTGQSSLRHVTLLFLGFGITKADENLIILVMRG